jgi:hypothetical protein
MRGTAVVAWPLGAAGTREAARPVGRHSYQKGWHARGLPPRQHGVRRPGETTTAPGLGSPCPGIFSALSWGKSRVSPGVFPCLIGDIRSSPGGKLGGPKGLQRSRRAGLRMPRLDQAGPPNGLGRTRSKTEKTPLPLPSFGLDVLHAPGRACRVAGSTDLSDPPAPWVLTSLVCPVS